MNREYIEKNQIVDRYLLGALDQQEQEEFEEFYFHNPDIIGELEVGDKMIEGFKAAREQGALPRSFTPKAPGATEQRWGSFAVPYSMAASVLLAISLFFNATFYREATEQGAATESLETKLAQAFSPQGSRIVGLDRTRSFDSAPSSYISISQEPEWFVLRLALDAEEAAYEDLTASLINDAGETVWQEPVVSNYSDDSVTISLHSSQMSARDYVVRIERLDGSGQRVPVASYGFGVRERH